MKLRDFIDQVYLRSNFKDNSYDELPLKIWPDQECEKNILSWNDNPNSFFMHAKNIFFQGPNIIIGDQFSFNKFFTFFNFRGLNSLMYSLNPKAVLILKEKRNYDLHKEIASIKVLYFNFIFKLMNANNNLPKSVCFFISVIQICVMIILLIIFRPSSIIVTEIHKYWKVIIAAKLLNIKSFLYVNNLVLPDQKEFSYSIIKRFIHSLPSEIIHSSELTFKQFSSLKINKICKNYLINKNGKKIKRNLTFREDLTTIIGGFQIFNKNSLMESEKILVYLIKKFIIKNPNYKLNFIPITEFDYLLYSFLKKNKYNVIQDYNNIFNSKKMFSFSIYISLEIFDNFGFSSSIITINNKHKEYIENLIKDYKFDLININI